MTNGRKFDKPEGYQIRVSGVLDKKWSDWFGGFSIIPQAADETLLTGSVADQAALHGLLKKVRNLGMPLLAVNRVESRDTEQVSEVDRSKEDA